MRETLSRDAASGFGALTFVRSSFLSPQLSFLFSLILVDDANGGLAHRTVLVDAGGSEWIVVCMGATSRNRHRQDKTPRRGAHRPIEAFAGNALRSAGVTPMEVWGARSDRFDRRAASTAARRASSVKGFVLRVALSSAAPFHAGPRGAGGRARRKERGPTPGALPIESVLPLYN